MEREALKLALEVMQINLTLLEKVDPYEDQEDLLSDSLDVTHKAIAAIKEALAQPVQPVQPVQAVQEPDGFNEARIKVLDGLNMAYLSGYRDGEYKALAQPAQEPVCDKDPQGCWNVRCQLGKQCKNLAQPAQEPVVQPAPGYCKNCKDYTIEEPLYAQPAQEPDAYQSGFYDGKKAVRARCIELVLSGTGEPVQTRTLEILQEERKRIAKLIEEDGKP